jgi:hypothetical protein
MKHAAIFVEGYQDRAFINQWLELRGLTRAPKQPGKGIFVKVVPGGSELWLLNTEGTSGLPTVFADFVAARGDDFEEFLVVNDSDLLNAAEAESRIVQSLQARVPKAAILNVSCWQPRLESLIEKALRATYQERFPAIDAFLTARVDPPKVSGKEAMHVFCSGWRSDSFGDDFYGDVLRPQALRANIEALMPHLVGHLTRLISR